MKAFHLAPLIGVSYWHNTPAGIMSARGPIAFDFAIVTIVVPGVVESSARFDMPGDRDALDAFLGAVNVAYSLGRLDALNATRRGLALDAVPIAALKITERGADDRD